MTRLEDLKEADRRTEAVRPRTPLHLVLVVVGSVIVLTALTSWVLSRHA